MDKEINIGDILFWKVYDYRLNNSFATQWGSVYKIYTDEHSNKMLSVYLINDALIKISNQIFGDIVGRTTEIPHMYVNGSVTIYDSSIHTIDQ